MNTWNTEFDKYFGDGKREDGNTTDLSDLDLGRTFGFSRIAIHHVILPPGCATSLPHAESLEEEFVYVLKGRPHLWLNGFVHELSEGHAIGFPAGTGIAHTFLNNSEEVICLLVAGETTKNENLCAFPVNPEMKAKSGIWWEDAPRHIMGPHYGSPGPVKAKEMGDALPECVFFCPEMRNSKTFHYPGDNETFGHGVRLTNKLGLKTLGIWYERLGPGRRSSFPHGHSDEEEFAYVVKGSLTVWMNGYVKKISEGEFVAFPPGTGIAHTLINDTDEEVQYLCFGEAIDIPDEKIIYPLNPLREEECRRRNWYWDAAPTPRMGTHPGKPERRYQGHLAFRSAHSDCGMEAGEGESKRRYLIDWEDHCIGYWDWVGDPVNSDRGLITLVVLDELWHDKNLKEQVLTLSEDYLKRAWSCKEVIVSLDS